MDFYNNEDYDRTADVIDETCYTKCNECCELLWCLFCLPCKILDMK